MLGRRLRRLQRGGCGGAERLLRRSFSTRLRLCLQSANYTERSQGNSRSTDFAVIAAAGR